VRAVFVDGAGTVALSERVREFLAGLERLVVDLPAASLTSSDEPFLLER